MIELTIISDDPPDQEEIEQSKVQPIREVRFEYCISILFITIHRQTEPIPLSKYSRKWRRSLPFCLISLTLGWWGIPWGIYLTPLTIWRNIWVSEDDRIVTVTE